MIEITAKQLYDIYRHLPKIEMFTYGIEPQHFVILKDTEQEHTTTQEVSFKIDSNIYPAEWKPTTDLIIKA